LFDGKGFSFDCGQPNPLGVMVEQIERLIEASGLDWIFLRPGMLPEIPGTGGPRKFAREISCVGRISALPSPGRA
jgi:hypothetical protein